MYWTTSIKDTIQWFPFLAIMEHTAKFLNKKGLINSLLKLFAMFDLRLIDDRDKVETVAIRFIICKKETGLYLVTFILEEMISKFVLNAILYHVSLS